MSGHFVIQDVKYIASIFCHSGFGCIMHNVMHMKFHMRTCAKDIISLKRVLITNKKTSLIIFCLLTYI